MASNDNLGRSPRVDRTDSTKTYRRRTVLQAGAATAASFSVAGCTGILGGDDLSDLRLGHAVPPEVMHGAFANVFIDAVEEKSDGEIQIQEFPNAELGTPPEMAEATSAGELDFSIVPAGPIFHEANVLNYPYTFDSHEHAARATDPTQSDVMEELVELGEEEANVRILVHQTYSTRNINLVGDPVYEPEELEGMVIRVPEQAIFREAISGLGASTTTIPQSELASALETGSVDGHDNGLIILWSFELQDLTDYTMLTQHMVQGDELMINFDLWNDLDETNQDILQEAALEATETSVERVENEFEQAMTDLQESGKEIIGPEDGLNVDAFQAKMEAHLEVVFPELQEYRERLTEF